MTPRRKKGTGTIELTEDGRFRARFPFTVDARETVGIFDTREEAARILDSIVVELRDRGHGRGTPLRTVVKKAHEERRAAGYASVASDEDRWSTYFERHALASTPVQELSEGDVVDAIMAFRRKIGGGMLALSTRKNILNMLRAALNVAKRDGLVSVNVLATTRFHDPKGKGKKAVRRVKRRALSWGAFQALCKVSKGAPGLVIAVWTGMRQGELRALHWPDVHNVGGVPCVCDAHDPAPHVLVRYGKPPTEAVSSEDECTPKNGETRTVALWGAALDAFETMHRGGAKNPRQIVFVSRLGGYRAKGKFFGRKAWTDWRTEAGVQCRFHDLRHTCGTWLVRGETRMGIDAAWPLEAVKEHLGHSELATTERYADQRDGAQARERAERARATKPGTSPGQIAQVQSHLRGLNSRPTVYEPGAISSASQAISFLAGLARAGLAAVEAGDPAHVQRALDVYAAALAAEDQFGIRRTVVAGGVA